MRSFQLQRDDAEQGKVVESAAHGTVPGVIAALACQIEEFAMTAPAEAVEFYERAAIHLEAAHHLLNVAEALSLSAPTPLRKDMR